jgi:glycosyltransferase involved in cell wall biosynthesis
MSRLMGFIHDQIAEAGHDVDFLCADDLSTRWHHALAQRLIFPVKARHRAVLAARSGRHYDIINIHEPSAAFMAASSAAAGSPVVIVTSHGLERRAWERAKEEARLGREGPALRTRLTYPAISLWPGQYGLRHADHVFCLSSEDRDYLIQTMARPPGSVTRIFPGADPAYADAAAGRDYRRCKRLLFAATWRKNKGVEDLVPAVLQLGLAHTGLELAVIGAGVPESAVRAHFPDWLQARITCLSPADEWAMARTYADGDIFLLPSLFEGTPLTLVQAMLSGLPIVTTDTCGMKDVIGDGVNGCLVPIRSPAAIVAAVTRLVGEPDLRARLGAAAQRDASLLYTWKRVAMPVLAVYEQLHERSTRPNR